MSTSHRSKSPTFARSTSLTDSIKFCHYKNAMYMGGMKFFEREGRGILLLDSGEIIVPSFEKDKLHGDTLLITKNLQLFSITYNQNQIVQIVTKNDKNIVFLKYRHGVPDGQAVIIDFTDEEIYYVVYKQGKIEGKAKEQNRQFHYKIFNHFTYSTLIPAHHLKILDFQFKNAGFAVVKKNSTITVGYKKQGFLNGLGFILSREQDNEKMSYMLIQKGYYKNSQLYGIGEKRFQNGNLYIGQFANNIFDGRGLLFNTERKSWVKGLFKDGTMIDMVDYENERDAKNPRISQMLQALHKKKSNWVNIDITFHHTIDFDNLINTVVSHTKAYVGDGVLTYQEKKELMLKKIQESFCPETLISGLVKQQTHSLKRMTATFGQDQKQEKKTINSFESQYDKMNNKLRLSPVIVRSPKRERRNRIEAREKEKMMESQNKRIDKSKRLQNSPELNKDLSEIKFSPYLPPKNQKVHLEQDQKKEGLKENRQSRLFSLAKSRRNVPPLHTSKITINKEEQHSFAESPLRQTTPENTLIETSTAKVDNRQRQSFSPVLSDTKRDVSGSLSKSRRHKIFNQTIKKSQFKNINAFSLSSSNLETNRQGQTGNSTPVSPKELKAAGLTRPTVRSRLFNNQKNQEEEELPTFRYSRFKNDNQSIGKSPRKGRIF